MEDSGIIIFVLLFYVAIIVFVYVAHWKLFVKAGKPGWASIVPFYNLVVMLEMIGKPVWWIFMFFIPFVNLYFAYLFSVSLAKSFGKDTGFGIGLLLLGIVFIPILAFGDAQYIGPDGVNPNDPIDEIGKN